MLCLIFCSSCVSRMMVTVDTFDREALLNSTEYKQYRATLMQSVEAEMQLVSAKLSPEFQSYAVDISTEAVKKQIAPLKDKEMNEATFDILASTTKDIFQDAYSKANEYYDKSIIEFEKHVRGESGFDRRLALDLADTGDGIKDEALTSLNESLKKFFFVDTISSFSFERFNREVPRVIQEKTESKLSTYGKPIGEDPMASLIAKAPEKYWNRYKASVDITDDTATREKNKFVKARYNHTKVKAVFGNADIAIKMEDPGNFVVKGVRIDADEAIKASFKVLNQGIKYLALSNGVTLPNAEADGVKSTTAGIPEIAENKKINLDIETITQTSEAALRNLLSTIFSQQAVLADSNKSTEHAQALDIIKKAYVNYKTQVNKSINPK
ncbi:MAG: hypothetical protein ACJAZV_002044 [Roseivirga sp.]